EVALTELDRMIEQEGVDVVIGTISSAVSLAVQDQAESMDFVMMNTISRSPALTGEACSPYSFRVNKNDLMDGAVIRAWLEANPEMLDLTWATLGYDYEWGHTALKGFKDMTGVKPVGEEYVPLGTKDFASYISKIKDAKPDYVALAIPASDLITFMNQQTGFGLNKVVKKMLSFSPIAEQYLEAMKDNALGLLAVQDYTWMVDLPASKKFVDAFKAANGFYPGFYDAESYTSGKLLIEAITKAKSDDPEKLIPVLEGMSYEAPYGKLTLRKEDHQAQRPVYIAEVVKEPTSSIGYAAKPVATIAAEKITIPVDKTGCKMK
ncbi:MAG: ABC transporter substrate-binding protein, partial [Chloroflexi bacterium]|nr:ABC transporter substrate-binding protein [Chloroflexota bacterium]